MTSRDVPATTERVDIGALIMESDGVHRLMIESVKDYGIFVLDVDGNVASWNEGARRIKGYDATDIIGRHFSTFYPIEDIESGKPQMELEVATAEGRFEDEGWRLRKDGTRFWANVIITALWSKERVLLGFAKVTRDLTERRAAEERAVADATRIAQAEGANRAKTEFLAMMSHELRTPLNAIGGYAELMQVGIGGTVSAQQLEYLHRIQASQQHLLGIINDLLNYSRIESGQLLVEVASHSVQSVIDDVVPLVQTQATAKGIALVVESGDDGLHILVDRMKSEQVLLNLLSNAVKFTPAGGMITVRAVAADDHVELQVQDTGPGIPLHQQTAIFEPFIQLGRNLTAPNEGVGLGLAISRDLAHAMGGNLSVRSNGDSGSTFVASFRRPS